MKTFIVSAKWRFRLNGDSVVAFDPMNGLETKQVFGTDREAIAEARRLKKLGAAVVIEEEEQ